MALRSLVNRALITKCLDLGYSYRNVFGNRREVGRGEGNQTKEDMEIPGLRHDGRV